MSSHLWCAPRIYFQGPVIHYLYKWPCKTTPFFSHLTPMLMTFYLKRFFSYLNVNCSIQHQSHYIMDYLSSSHHQLQKIYMIISCKSPFFSTTLYPLSLNSFQLECVDLFKYLGVIIQSVHSKVCQTIGVIHHNFNQHASSKTLFTLCYSLVIPYFSYCTCIWDTPASSNNSENFKKLNTLL